MRAGILVFFGARWKKDWEGYEGEVEAVEARAEDLKERSVERTAAVVRATCKGEVTGRRQGSPTSPTLFLYAPEASTAASKTWSVGLPLSRATDSGASSHATLSRSTTRFGTCIAQNRRVGRASARRWRRFVARRSWRSEDKG